MPERSSKKKPDQPQPPAAPPAAETADQPGADGKNPAAVTLGRLGGKKTGPARVQKLRKEQRQEIARKAAQGLWAKWT